MSEFVPKAESVGPDGQPDGFVPGTFYKPEVLEGGYSRLVISLPPERLAPTFRALAAALEPPCKLLYQQLTDRRTGQQLSRPRPLVAVELPRDRLLAALDRYAGLIYEDGRHQLWLRGAYGEQVVLEEIGMIYAYPDDPSFRDVLQALGIPEGKGPTLAERDYIKVNFSAEHDAQEEGLIRDLHLLEWQG